MVVGGDINLSIKFSSRLPRPGFEPATLGFEIRRHNHKAKRSGVWVLIRIASTRQAKLSLNYHQIPSLSVPLHMNV